jgi:dipeptidyl aminopeptidase/acylaminoacyl peptidase
MCVRMFEPSFDMPEENAPSDHDDIADRTVPIEHGKKFYEAVRLGNPHVEWIEYPEEGHGWRYQHTRLDFWARVERFLGENLGKGR